ncbi:MAG: glycosyltransferase [Blastocatellia bacterium]|nr:glycosyltransferase [Blastocatellia bacterium]
MARNRGISRAAGEFISFIDSDDLWSCDKLQAQVDALQQREGDVAYSWTSYLSQGKAEAVPGRRNFFEGNIYAELLKKNVVASGSNILARTELIREVGGFDPTFPQCADWDLCLRLAARCRFALVPKHQIFYRVWPNSMTSNQIDEMERQCLLMLEKTYRSAPAEYQRLKRRSVHWVYEYCTERYLQGTTRLHPLAATRTLCMAVQSQPLTILHRHTQRLVLKLLKFWFVALKNALRFGTESFDH